MKNRVLYYAIAFSVYGLLWKLISFEFAVISALSTIVVDLYILEKKKN